MCFVPQTIFPSPLSLPWRGFLSVSPVDLEGGGHLLCCLMRSFNYELRPYLKFDFVTGEFTAAAAAGAFSFEDGIKIVQARGEAMECAAAQHPGGMVAVTAAAAGHQVIKAEFGGKMLAANVLAEGVVVYAGLSSHCDQLVAFCNEFMRRGQVWSSSNCISTVFRFSLFCAGEGKGNSRCRCGSFPYSDDAGMRGIRRVR